MRIELKFGVCKWFPIDAKRYNLHCGDMQIIEVLIESYRELEHLLVERRRSTLGDFWERLPVASGLQTATIMKTVLQGVVSSRLNSTNQTVLQKKVEGIFDFGSSVEHLAIYTSVTIR
jgi:hypothetical protein